MPSLRCPHRPGRARAGAHWDPATPGPAHSIRAHPTAFPQLRHPPVGRMLLARAVCCLLKILNSDYTVGRSGRVCKYEKKCQARLRVNRLGKTPSMLGWRGWVCDRDSRGNAGSLAAVCTADSGRGRAEQERGDGCVAEPRWQPFSQRVPVWESWGAPAWGLPRATSRASSRCRRSHPELHRSMALPTVLPQRGCAPGHPRRPELSHCTA